VTVSSKSHQEEELEEGRDGWKIEWKLSEVDIWAVPRRQNELKGKFKIAASDCDIARPDQRR